MAGQTGRPAVEVRGLTKQYGDVAALDGLDLTVPTGRVVGLLGPNGAGKSTAIRILMGFARATAGHATVLGEPIGASTNGDYRSRAGYLPDVPGFYPWMTARDWMALAGSLAGVDRATGERRTGSLLEMAGLAGVTQRIGGYSRGMRQRLGIAQALIGAPELLILDEPTSALDPLGRRDVLGMIAGLRGRATVLLSTHVLSDVERVCDEVVIVHRGRSVAAGTVAELRARRGHVLTVRAVVDGDATPVREALAREPWCSSIHDDGDALVLTVTSVGASRVRLPRLVADAGLGLRFLVEVEPTLEDVFAELVGATP
ncbi:MAG TPA: ABC transporter ATP-binding protein [Actinomycetaceae bacterium]|nr:ABC transporter ATP-binding protein [Actinomycetaceae bacterium]